jgi:hypothetical protein
MPEYERCEDRALLATTAAPAPPASSAFHGFLAPYDQTGSVRDVTNISRPTFVGNATQNSVVTLSAVRYGGDPTQTIPLGQAIANSAGAWTLNAPFLPDGAYAVVGSAVLPVHAGGGAGSQGGDPSTTIKIVPRLIIDTVGPRVAHLAFDPGDGRVEIVFSDAGSGVDAAKAANAENYTIVPPGHAVGYFASNPPPTPAPSIAGFYTSAQGEVVLLAFPGPIPRGRYLFQINSGGVTDVAGNALDGEFTGRYPSGDGVPGGNFIARFTVPAFRPGVTAASRRVRGPLAARAARG